MNSIPEQKVNPSHEMLKPDDPSLTGIGGWLIVVIIGRALSILIGIKDIFELTALIGNDIKLDMLISASIIIDILFVIILSGVILFFIFTRNIIFRMIFVIQVIINIVVNFSMYVFINNLGYMGDSLYLLGPVITGAIWIAYLYKSKRVKNTYVSTN